jgi:hypothetical protein
VPSPDVCIKSRYSSGDILQKLYEPLHLLGTTKKNHHNVPGRFLEVEFSERNYGTGREKISLEMREGICLFPLAFEGTGGAGSLPICVPCDTFSDRV